MKPNVGTIDMILRLIVAAALLYMGFFDNPIISGGLPKTVIAVAAFVPLLTGLLRFCPLYSLIGLSTVGKKTG